MTKTFTFTTIPLDLQAQRLQRLSPNAKRLHEFLKECSELPTVEALKETLKLPGVVVKSCLNRLIENELITIN